MSPISRIQKYLIWALLAAFIVLALPVLLADRSAEARLEGQFPWDFHPEPAGPFLREELEIADCRFIITTRHLRPDESEIDGERLVLDLADLDGEAASAGNGFITLPLAPGRYAACTKTSDGRPCGKAERDRVQLNLPRLRETGKEARYLGYVRELIAACRT